MDECRDVQERIEAIAAGDEPASAAWRAHVEGCVRCAAALASARRIEAALAARPAPPAPAHFSSAVSSRIRRERWRSEQQVDRLFNAAVGVALVTVVGGALALLNLSGVTGAVVAGLSAINSGLTQVSGRVAAQASAAASTYLLAGGFLATALLVWWLAEGDRTVGSRQ